MGVRDYDASPFGQAPPRWQHYERDPSNGSSEPIEFELFWVKMPEEVPSLIAGLGEFLASIEGRR